MCDWPACSGPRRWSRERLVGVAGPRTVPVELGRNYTSDQWTQKLMTVKEFVNRLAFGTYLQKYKVFLQCSYFN